MSVWDALDNNKILQGDCLEVLKTLPDESVDTCVTSPPYYGLRDYGTGEWIGGDPNCKHEKAAYVLHPKGGSDKQRSNQGSEVTAYEKVCSVCGAVRVDRQIGLEDTPEQYVQRLVDVFREVKRVLKADGTLWVNIGDSYAGGAGRWGGLNDISEAQKANKGSLTQIQTARKWTHAEIKPKDLIGIPWLLAFALRADGWYLRQDIIWHKPNPMPESVKDRCTKSHEYVFLFSKNPHYYFDYEAIQEDSVCKDDKRHGAGRIAYGGKRLDGSDDKAQQSFVAITDKRNKRDVWTVDHKNLQYNGQQNHTMHERRADGLPDVQYEVRNKRDVWTVQPAAYKGAHFATFPPKLIEPCILAGSKPGGIVLDPFFGSGTTGVVANKFNRSFIGIELNKEYIELAKKRTANKQITLEGVI